MRTWPLGLDFESLMMLTWRPLWLSFCPLQLWVWPNLRRRLFSWKCQWLWLCWMSKIAATDPLRRSLHGWCRRSPGCHWWPQRPQSGVAALGGVCLQRSTAQSQVTWNLARMWVHERCIFWMFFWRKQKTHAVPVSQALWKVILSFFLHSGGSCLKT